MKLPTLPQLKPRERLLAVGCGVVLVIVVLDRFVIGPWTQHVRVVRREIHHMQDALRTHARLLSRRERVFGELAAYQAYLKPVQSDDLEKAAIVKEVQELAANTSVVIGDIKALSSESNAVARRFPIDVRDTCETLFERAIKATLPLFIDVCDEFSRAGRLSPSGDRWERQAVTRAEFERWMTLSPADPADEVARKVRALAHSRFPGPFFEIDGVCVPVADVQNRRE